MNNPYYYEKPPILFTCISSLPGHNEHEAPSKNSGCTTDGMGFEPIQKLCFLTIRADGRFL